MCSAVQSVRFYTGFTGKFSGILVTVGEGLFLAILCNYQINLFKLTLFDVSEFIFDLQGYPKSVKSFPFYTGFGSNFS